jgi:hypothetical protein
MSGFLTSSFSTIIRRYLFYPLLCLRRANYFPCLGTAEALYYSLYYLPSHLCSRRITLSRTQIALELLPSRSIFSTYPPQNHKHSTPKDATPIATSIGSCLCPKSLICQCCLKFESGAMVDADVEAHKSHQAPSQQRTSTPEMFDRNSVIVDRYMDSDFHNVSQGPGCRTAQGLESSDRSSIQLSTSTYRSIHCTCGHGITERGRIQAHTRLDRISDRVS